VLFDKADCAVRLIDIHTGVPVADLFPGWHSGVAARALLPLDALETKFHYSG